LRGSFLQKEQKNLQKTEKLLRVYNLLTLQSQFRKNYRVYLESSKGCSTPDAILPPITHTQEKNRFGGSFAFCLCCIFALQGVR